MQWIFLELNDTNTNRPKLFKKTYIRNKGNLIFLNVNFTSEKESIEIFYFQKSFSDQVLKLNAKNVIYFRSGIAFHYI
jgi:hypothetical protein